MVVASPTRRTLHTAALWAEGTGCGRFVHPLLGPRMVPLVAGQTGLPCDRHLDRGTLAREFGAFARPAGLAAALWAEGINALPDAALGPPAEAFLAWCRRMGRPRVHVVSHDGTIAWYRHRIAGRPLTRAGFLGDAGVAVERSGCPPGGR